MLDIFGGTKKQRLLLSVELRWSVILAAAPCCCSVAKSCLTLCNFVDYNTPTSSVLYCLPDFAQIHVHWMGDANLLILCCPLLLLPSFFPSIRVLSNESVLCIRCLKYWSFSNSSSNKYSEFISFRIDWFEPLAAQGTSLTIPVIRE